MKGPYIGEEITLAAHIALFRKSAGQACDRLRRRPTWSPSAELTVCACGGSIAEHACRLAVELYDRAQRRRERP